MALRALEYIIRASDQTGRAFQSVDRRLSTTERAIRGAGRALAGAFSVAAMLRFANSVEQAVKETAKLVDVADKVGLTVEALQQLQYAGEQNGIAANTMNMAMQRFSRRIGEASANSGELLAVLKANNFQIRDQEGNVRPLVDLLGDYAELIKNAGSEQEALTLAFKAFDSEGAAIVNALRDGRDGLQRYIEKADALGTITDENARAAKRFDDRMTDLSRTLEYNYKTAILGALQEGENFIDQMRDMGDAAADFLDRIGLAGTAEGRARGALQFALDFRADNFANEAALAREIQGLRNQAVNRAGKGNRQRTKLPDPEADKKRRASASAAEKHAEAIDKLITGLQLERELIGATAVEQKVMNSLRSVDVDLMSEQGRQIAELIRGNDALQTSYEAAQSRAEFFAQTAFDGLVALRQEGARVEDVLLRLVETLGMALLKGALLGQGPLASLSGGLSGGLLGSLFGGIPGFASGGSGVVPGTGGRDSKLFVARVTPGEHYQFTPPGGGGGSGGPMKVIVEAAPSQYFDLRVREISGDVATRTSVAVVGEADRRRRRAEKLGSR